MINITDLKQYEKNREQYNKETEEFNARIESYLKEINENINYILTEQERQRYEQMTMTELVQEMLENQKNMRETLNKMLEKWGDR